MFNVDHHTTYNVLNIYDVCVVYNIIIDSILWLLTQFLLIILFFLKNKFKTLMLRMFLKVSKRWGVFF